MGNASLFARLVAVGVCVCGVLTVCGGAAAYAARRPITELTASVRACSGAHLAVTTGSSQAGSTHVGLAIEFRNRSTTACHLRGYPRVVALDARGTVIVVASQTLSGYLGGVMNGSRTLPLVVVQPGKAASAFVEGFDFNEKRPSAASCPPYAALLVTPPDASRATRLRLTATDGQGLCSGLSVHPVVPGTSGRLAGAAGR